jgi:1,4-alpha-glucan branching enzyme
MTFGLLYAFTERFILPLSHDEVVYGKGSLIGKMAGDPWRRFASLRAYLAFMWTHPGKKLLFMGGEIGQESEWSHDGELSWESLDQPLNAGLQRLVRDLNRLHREEPALHVWDADPRGFRWLVGDDAENSAFAFLRSAPDAAALLVAVNFTPVPRTAYRIGVPGPGRWRCIFNSDAQVYGGGNVGGPERVHAEPAPAHGEPWSIETTLPPLAGLILKREDEDVR